MAHAKQRARKRNIYTGGVNQSVYGSKSSTAVVAGGVNLVTRSLDTKIPNSPYPVPAMNGGMRGQWVNGSTFGVVLRDP